MTKAGLVILNVLSLFDQRQPMALRSAVTSPPASRHASLSSLRSSSSSILSLLLLRVDNQTVYTNPAFCLNGHPEQSFLYYCSFSLEQLAGSSPFFIISGAVQKVTEDGVVHAILY